MDKTTLHLVALPHVQLGTAKTCLCAYSSKCQKFIRMMNDRNIILYAPEGQPLNGCELITCLSDEERIQTFGGDDPNRLPSWPSAQQTELFNQRVIDALRERVGKHDIILLTAGWTHKPIADAFPNHICCEPGVGYEGILTPYCAFESYAWMHHCYAKNGITDGRFFDAVIPNYFDPDEFPVLNNGGGKYLLFLGRIISRKGPHIASEIAERCGIPLKVAGAGGRQEGNDIVSDEVVVKNAEYMGPVNIMQRAELLSNAACLICPTTYIEPFGGVAVEAMMCGTPVISIDWGAFTETVEPWVTGFRFRILDQAVRQVRQASFLDPRRIQRCAIDKYSLDATRPRFNEWFNRLSSLWGKGWYS